MATTTASFTPAQQYTDKAGDVTILSFVIMFVALVLQGIYFWARDAVTPSPLPIPFVISDLVWAASLVPLILYRWYPAVTVVSAWILFLTLAMVLEPTSEHTLSWFIWRNGLVLTNLVFAHIGLYFKRKRSRTLVE